MRDHFDLGARPCHTSWVRKGCSYISAEVWDARSFWSDLATESHLFGLPGCSGIGEARSFCSELVTESYLVVPAVRVELVLRELYRLLELTLVARVYSVQGGGD